MWNKSETLPRRIILTDDPLRAKMMWAHNLEYASQVYEQDDVLVYAGSYKDVPITLASAGFGKSAVLSFLRVIFENSGEEKAEVVYIGECAATTDERSLRDVIIANGGSNGLQARAQDAAKRNGMQTTVATIKPEGESKPDEESIGHSGITDEVTHAMYDCAKAEGAASLSILTISENRKTGEKMEEHERRSRLYAAARLAFETLAADNVC